MTFKSLGFVFSNSTLEEREVLWLVIKALRASVSREVQHGSVRDGVGQQDMAHSTPPVSFLKARKQTYISKIYHLPILCLSFTYCSASYVVCMNGFSFFPQRVYFMCLSVLRVCVCVCVCVCTTCMPGACESQLRASNSLELEL